MESHHDSQAFKACYAQFKKGDADRNILVGQLLEDYEALHKENVKVHEQLENERETRILWQDNARNYKKELNRTRLATESHPFVVMIIDGDGAKFRNEYFRDGDNGGGSAAQELKKQIKCHLQAKYPDTSIDNWNIIVHFYANMDGLAKVLASRRILSHRTDLQKFASGFGRANSLFSFVDVGYGKDKADHKCREMLKVMLHVSSCRHVFFGPCRDNGYLTLLEEYKHDPVSQKKLTLFAAEPAEPGFVDLDFEIAKFPTVFRTEPLDNLVRASVGIQPCPCARTPLALRRSSNSADDFSDLAASSFAPTAPSPTPSPSVGNISTSASAPAPPTWAVVSKLSSGPVIDLYNKKTASPKLRYALFNAANLRIDERIPAADFPSVRSLDNRARAQGRNFCNSYHLSGSCDKGSGCEYVHDCEPRLTISEKTAMRHKSRQMRCSDGQWCSSPHCLNGHHCKNVYLGNACSWGSRCFFSDSHEGLDLKATLKVFEDGTREDLTLKVSAATERDSLVGQA